MRTLPLSLSTSLAVVVLAGIARAQLEPDWIAQLPVGAALNAGLADAVVDPSGVTYLTAITGPSSNTDIVTAAYAPDGTELWSTVFNGPGDWHDQARGIALGGDGSVWVTGNTPGPGKYANVLLIQYDALTGAQRNLVQYSSGPFTAEHGASVACDADGNVYVAGGTVGDGSDVMVLSFDPAGAFRWKTTWDGPAWGPYSQDVAKEILVDPSGCPIVMVNGIMGGNLPDFVVLKYAPADGALVWQATWGGRGGESPIDMVVDPSGDVFVTGVAIDLTNKFSTIRLRGADGSLVWQAYDARGLDDAPSSLFLQGGSVYVTGTWDPDGDESNFNDNFYTVKRDAASGGLLWTHSYGANCVGCLDAPSDLLVDPGGHVILGGFTSSPPYGSDMITLVLDAGTGAEVLRDVLPGGPLEAASSGLLFFDAAYRHYDVGGTYHVNNGQKTIRLVRYPSLVGPGPGGIRHAVRRLVVSELVSGEEVTFSVEGMTPFAPQLLAVGLEGLDITRFSSHGGVLDLAGARLLAAGVAGADGTFSGRIAVPAAAMGSTVWMQAVEPAGRTPCLERTIH